MRLIDADRVLRLVDNGNLISNSNYQKVRKLIENIPSIDLVRCKDCKRADTSRCPFYKAGWGYTDDDFCSYGERGEQDD